ncbi:MAG: YicC family protein [Muribaculaceae bacterium]|nr:YicC family protein [Muribaculaceae bacterium]
MILSMTGFGKAVKVYNNKKITAELKSLNSKQLDFGVRIPQNYREIEMELRNEVSKALLRGKIDLFVYCEPIEGAPSGSINVPMLKQYKQQIEEMAKALDLPEPNDWYATLLRMPDALKTDAKFTEVEKDELNVVKEVVLLATEELIAFRRQEGARLATFFEEKIAAIQALLNEVPRYEEPRIKKIKARILDSLAKLKEADYDKNRFEQELIYYIEKLDITEEKIRLQNHLNYFLETMHSEQCGQGKKLGFISQEIGREVNTMGSKANQAELQNLVVHMKDHLEQIKEQVLNVL